MEPTSIDRKAFLKQAGLLTCTVFLAGPACQASLAISLPSRDRPESAGQRQPTYRVVGLPDQAYSRGFNKLCRYGRFASLQQAIASVHNPRTEFLVVCD